MVTLTGVGDDDNDKPLTVLSLSYLEVDDEDEGVVIFNLLHGGLSRQRIANDGISIHAISVRRALPERRSR